MIALRINKEPNQSWDETVEALSLFACVAFLLFYAFTL